MQVLILCEFGSKMSIHDPLEGAFRVKTRWGCFLGKTETFCSFMPLGMQYHGTDILWIKQLKKLVLWEASKIWGHKKGKTKNHTRVIFHIFAGMPPLRWSVWILAFGWCCWRNHPGQILWQSIWGFGVLIPQFFPFSECLSGRSYISIRTTMLYCDNWMTACFSK